MRCDLCNKPIDEDTGFCTGCRYNYAEDLISLSNRPGGPMARRGRKSKKRKRSLATVTTLERKGYRRTRSTPKHGRGKAYWVRNTQAGTTIVFNTPSGWKSRFYRRKGR